MYTYLNKPMQNKALQNGFFMLLLVGMLVLCFLIFLPYLGALVLAAVFAVIFYPLYQKILQTVGQRTNLAAFLTTVCILIIIFIPFVVFGFQLFQEMRQIYVQITDPQAPFSSQFVKFIETRVQQVVPNLQLDVRSYVRQSLEWLLQHVGSIFASTAQVGIGMFISLFALFYLLRDGRELTRRVVDLSPLKDWHDQKIVTRLHDAVKSVVQGSLMIAVTQGVVTGIGLTLFGVPNAVLWGSITVLAALIPSVGTAAVIAPAVVYLVITEQLGAGIGLLIWGVFAVGLIDNVLGPRLINRGMRLHPMIILLAVIGGLQFFGPIGYVLGPLVISFLFALLDIYPMLVLKENV